MRANLSLFNFSIGVILHINELIAPIRHLMNPFFSLYRAINNPPPNRSQEGSKLKSGDHHSWTFSELRGLNMKPSLLGGRVVSPQKPRRGEECDTQREQLLFISMPVDGPDYFCQA
jgi:hypothetical protein